MVVVPEDTDMHKITWVTNTKVLPNRLIICKICKGVIFFNYEELALRISQGLNTSTPCQHDQYHPTYPPEPHYIYDGIITSGERERRIEFT